MLFVLINTLLYIGVSVLYWLRYRKFDAYMLLLSAYTGTAVMCLAYYSTAPDAYQGIALYPFIYLVVVLLIFLRPFKGLEFDATSMNVHETWHIKALMWTVIVSGLVSLFFTIPEAVELIQSGEWGMLRNMLYEDEESVELYHNSFERIAKNINGYMHPFTVVMVFYYLSKEKTDKIVTFLLLTVWLGNSFFGAMLVASRGLVITMLLELVLTLVLFKNVIDKKTKQVLTVTGIVMLIPVAIYMIAVSVSRFGEEDAGGSVFTYLGHSMLNFNANMMVPMHDYAGGKYFAQYLLNLLGLDSTINLQELGYTGGTGFYTFIGSFYIDFGPMGTFLLAVLMMAILNRFANREQKSISDMMVIVFFLIYYLKGVFVIGTSSALSWLMLMVLFMIVRYAENIPQQEIIE